MALNEPRDGNEEFPVSAPAPHSIPVWTILLSAGLLVLIVLLALSY